MVAPKQTSFSDDIKNAEIVSKPSTVTPTREVQTPEIVIQTPIIKPQPNHMVDVREIKTDIFNPIVWEQMKGMAETFVKSGALPQTENSSKLVMKMQAGREMGMAPVESIKSFYFVNGTINVFGAATTKRLRDHGWRINFVDEPNKCTATITKNDETYTDTLTFDEANKSGWTSAYGKLKPGWVEGINRKLKLRYGVLSLLIKTYVPEVLGSAVDIAEVAMDAAPAFENSQTQIINADDNDPATADQLDTLKNLGVEDVPNEITKGQARMMIQAEATKNIKGGK